MKPKPKTHNQMSSFADDIEALVTYIAKHWTGLKHIKPKEYDNFLQDYTDFKGMKELNTEALENDFQGCDDSTATSFSFPIRMSLPHIAYDDICQGRDPFRMLVAACVEYGMMRGEAYATRKLDGLQQEIKLIQHGLDTITARIQNQ